MMYKNPQPTVPMMNIQMGFLLPRPLSLDRGVRAPFDHDPEQFLPCADRKLHSTYNMLLGPYCLPNRRRRRRLHHLKGKVIR